MGFLDSVSNAFQDVAHNVGGVWNDVTGKSQQKSANQQNVKLQQMANEANIALQKSQQDWEGMMSNTAVQRRKDDLVAAGINPLLAAGGAADVPNVAPARVEAAHVSPVPSVAQGVTSAIQAYQTYGASKLLEAQARKTNAEAGVVEQYGGAQASTSVELAKAGVQKIAAEMENLNAETNLKLKEQTWTQIRSEIDGLTLEQKSALFKYAVEQQKAAMEASTKQSKAAAAGQDTEWARIAAYIGQFFTNLNPFNSASSAAGAAASMLR